MRSAGPVSLLVLACLFCGCASGLAREGRCLEAMTPAFLRAQAELAQLEAAWRALAAAAPVGRPARLLFADPLPEHWIQQRWAARDRLQEARQRHHRTVEWYDRVYRRVRLRMEEAQLLSEVFWALAPTPGLLFYPVVRWNMHTVMWDGTDPDADSDEIRRYCSALVESVGREQEGSKWWRDISTGG